MGPGSGRERMGGLRGASRHTVRRDQLLFKHFCSRHDRVTRAVVAEFLGTALLLAAVVGSGIMGERLASGNLGIVLLANSMATGAMLLVLILIFAPVSGAHFNPIVTVLMASRTDKTLAEVLLYIGAQLSGAVVGVASANIMFDLPAFQLSHHARSGGAQLFSEFVATFGLLLVISLCGMLQPRMVAGAVACYITAAYWFTSSTSFANPAATVARALTDTFSGIRAANVPGFVVAQCFGGATAVWLVRWMRSRPARGHDTGDKKEL